MRHAPFDARVLLPIRAISVCLAILAGVTGGALGQGLTEVEQRIVEHVDSQAEEAIAMLEQSVNVNSGTMNHIGVRAVGRALEPHFEELGFTVRWIDMPAEVNRAGHLFAARRGERGRKVLLIGHLDTVFEEDSPFQRFEREGNTARGPGVEDMKGGNLVILYALKALHAAGALEHTSITVAFTGDEENPGHPIEISRRDLIDAGIEADVALGFEGGVGSANSATVARRGSSGWMLKVTGTRGHSSQIFGEDYGSGAIFEVARILNAFHEEVRGEEYLTFNPGVILGGTDIEYDPALNRGGAFGKTNVIAQTVVVDGGLRFISEEQKERAWAKMREIVADHLPGTTAEIEFRDSYPAMPPTAGNQDLFELFDRVSRDLGLGAIDAVDPGARGAADISFVAPHADGLAGLGPLGDGGHTVEESVELGSLRTATLRAALLIHRLTRGE
jgi:glutamate carboxypeptidase